MVIAMTKRTCADCAYGTSPKTSRLYSGEFRIAQNEHPAADTSAGLSFKTKFNLKHMLELPFNGAYFLVAPHELIGTRPQLTIKAQHQCHWMCG